MPSTNNNVQNLTRSALQNRDASMECVENCSDVQDETDFSKGPLSAFSQGPKGGSINLDSGYSDDSDFPRLSPIRTSSGTALYNREKKYKLVTASKDLGQRSMSRSCFYEEAIFKPPRVLFLNGGRDSSDLLSQEGSMTATSGACSAFSDALQNSSPSEPPTKIPNIDNDPLSSQKEGFQHQRSRSHLSTFFDNLTMTLNRGLSNLAIRVERATSAARELSSGMRSATETRPDATFFEVCPTEQIVTDKLGEDVTPMCSTMSTATATLPPVPTISFDTSFNLHGGQDLYDELETLCNEYAKKLNKLRTRLTDGDKDRLDRLITRLYPVFDVVETHEEGDPEEKVDDRLTFLYLPLGTYVGQTLGSVAQKERSSTLEIADLVANPVNVLGSASHIPLTPQTSRCPELYVEFESAVQHGKRSVELIHEDGIKSIAQLSSLCVNCLLEIANELVLSPDSPKKIQWPSSGLEIGRLLRTFVVRLVQDLVSVAGSFVGALLGIGSAYDENLLDGSVGQKAQGLACDLELDSGTAVMKVQESLRNLMYIVVCVTFQH